MKPERVEFTVNMLERSLEHVRTGNFHAAITNATEAEAEVIEMQGPKKESASNLLTEIFQFLNGGHAAFAAEKIRNLIEIVRNFKSS